jgi:hypothetical protein
VAPPAWCSPAVLLASVRSVLFFRPTFPAMNAGFHRINHVARPAAEKTSIERPSTYLVDCPLSMFSILTCISCLDLRAGRLFLSYPSWWYSWRFVPSSRRPSRTTSAHGYKCMEWQTWTFIQQTAPSRSVNLHGFPTQPSIHDAMQPGVCSIPINR